MTWQVRPSEAHPGYFDITSTGRVIAVVEHREDAELMAASVKMFHALDALVKLYEDDDGCRELPEYKNARAALARAEAKP